VAPQLEEKGAGRFVACFEWARVAA
jgi:hypothetical protein